MPKAADQKLRLLYLIQIFIKKTDNDHGITLEEILAELAKHQIVANRKTIYDDIYVLNQWGYQITHEKKNYTHYYYIYNKEHFENDPYGNPIQATTFSISELILLTDAIQSSKYIPRSNSDQLIKKLKTFASIYEEKQLDRHNYIEGITKSQAPRIHYTINTLNNSINDDCQIEMYYKEWTLKKQLEQKPHLYHLSIWAMIWLDENYYIVAYDHDEDKIKHFRIDKIGHIRLCPDKKRDLHLFEGKTVAQYVKQRDNMFGDDIVTVTLKAKKHLIGIFIDKFGKNIPIEEYPEYFITQVNIIDAPPFYGWLFALGADIEVLEPSSIKNTMISMLEKQLQQQKS